MTKNKNPKDISNSGKHWTEEEITFLKTYYGTCPNLELAIELKRPTIAITHKAARLKLKKKNKIDYTKDTLVCTKCKQERNKSQFSANKSKSSGYQSICKSCEKLAYEKNKIEKLQKQREELKNKENTCTKCGKTKIGSEFPIKKRGNKYQFLNTCVKCKREEDLNRIVDSIKEGKDW